MERFSLEAQDATPTKELLDTLDDAQDLEDLNELAFNTPEIGSIYFSLRYQHLCDEQEGFTTKYPELAESGYLISPAGDRTDTHITQIENPQTDNDFLHSVRPMIKAFLEYEEESPLADAA